MKSAVKPTGTAVKEEGRLKEILDNLPQNQSIFVCEQLRQHVDSFHSTTCRCFVKLKQKPEQFS